MTWRLLRKLYNYRTINYSVFPHFVGDRAILKNDWNEVMDLILKPRPGGKCTTLTLFSAAVEAVAKSISSFPLSRFFLLQRRKNFWSAAGKSGQRLRIRRQHWKSFPTSAVWKDSCWEACLCMARKTSSLHLDWLVFYCSLVTSWCSRTKGFTLIIPQINLPCLQVTVTRETIQSEIQTYL